MDAEAQFMCGGSSLRCRIGQTPQNDVSDAIPQRLPGDLQSVLVGEFYEKVQFRIEESQHDDLLDCLKTLYPDEPGLTVAKGMKLLANALLKSKVKNEDVNVSKDNDDFIKTTMYLTGKQRTLIEKAAHRHGWNLSRECRYRIQTTLENELDFSIRNFW
nr:hypothetical protein [Escherichia coli]